MTSSFLTDGQTDRLMSLRASYRIPLPPEIALTEARDAQTYFDWLLPYQAMGLAEHPVVRLLSHAQLNKAMAAAVSKAEHLDRVAHYSAYLGRDIVRVVDLCSPTRDDPEGDD